MGKSAMQLHYSLDLVIVWFWYEKKYLTTVNLEGNISLTQTYGSAIKGRTGVRRVAVFSGTATQPAAWFSRCTTVAV